MAPFFLTLDFNQGVLADPLDFSIMREKAFFTPFGLHHFVTQPFGLSSEPTIFQSPMDRILHPHNMFATAYLVDINIYSNDWKHHLQHMRRVQLSRWKYNIWVFTLAMG